jgi:hypothetical protein
LKLLVSTNCIDNAKKIWGRLAASVLRHYRVSHLRRAVTGGRHHCAGRSHASHRVRCKSCAVIM